MANPTNALRISDSQDHKSIPGEVWKPVPSEAGVLASNKGRVLLPPRYAPVAHGGFRAYFPKPRFGQVSREHKDAAHTYRIIMVHRPEAKAKQSPRKIHQLVCEAFHGEKPFPDAVVIHINEDAHDNRPENLKWGTQKENLNAPGFKAGKLVAPVVKECAHCGKKYRRDSPAQKYCSLDCHHSSRRKARAGTNQAAVQQ